MFWPSHVTPGQFAWRLMAWADIRMPRKGDSFTIRGSSSAKFGNTHVVIVISNLQGKRIETILGEEVLLKEMQEQC